ncbi:5284_t:CDS:2 [Ambispora leptoticha]|uniref:5284_t:CDS:1 n=1 Tax=Ambispora leptoticha TaxID=144679 RepID=A0A9N9DWU9_9GLOM|nr:5284_t:CDS:2 [Ambispora leptoticha]
MPPVKRSKADTLRRKSKDELKEICMEYGLPTWGSRGDLEDRIQDQHKSKNKIFEYCVDEKRKPKASSSSTSPVSLNVTMPENITKSSPTSASFSSSLSQSKNADDSKVENSVEVTAAEILCAMVASKTIKEMNPIEYYADVINGLLQLSNRQ